MRYLSKFQNALQTGYSLVRPDRPMPVDDFWTNYAINEIYKTYGDRVDIWDKGKSLLKFGATNNADSGVVTTVAQFGSVGTPNVRETYSTTNDIDAASSSNGLLFAHTGSVFRSKRQQFHGNR